MLALNDNDPKNWDRYRFAFCQTSRGIARSVKSYAKKGFTLKAIKVVESNQNNNYIHLTFYQD